MATNFTNIIGKFKKNRVSDVIYDDTVKVDIKRPIPTNNSSNNQSKSVLLE